ncbi:phage tail protein [Flavobacterium covae]|uniref:hypothetical protein n=1 Tax=Flavobacterium covae TaxID=2906076 RepID=UPI000745EA2E|nr:hypothetical protein [Flavobacterium covae]AMA50312.1 hypothetical protein AWN65_12995 [Flavobacterium covae]MCJ1808463.1 hypothetical protein [Flavobacterium covae]
MKVFNNVLFLFFAISITACDDILEKDITTDVVNVLTPKEGSVIESNIISFQWEPLKGANKYRLQIEDKNALVIKDTITTKNSLKLPLLPGKYKFKIRGENQGYESKYTISSSFDIKLPTSLENQLVILKSPSNGFFTNRNNLILIWDPIKIATTYTLELYDVTNSNLLLLSKEGLTTPTYVLDATVLKSDALYEWRVKAINTTSSTDFNKSTFSLDTTPPNAPQNLLPNNAETRKVNSTVELSWKLDTDSGTIKSPIDYYIIEFATDVDFTKNFESQITTTTNYQKIFTATATYFWRVKAKDKAGNIGSLYSKPNSLLIN